MKIFIITLLIAGLGVFVWFTLPKKASAPESDLQIDKKMEPIAEGEKPAEINKEVKQENKKENKTNMTTATFKTNKGDIVLELFTEQMPITTGNFIKLAKESFYNKTKFHRVIKNFMIQGGDPNSKGDDKNTYGIGGPGYTIKDEFVAGLSNVRGTIAMANTGQPNSGGSQFFINQVDNIGLDFDKPLFSSSHPVFGKVIKGLDVVDAIANLPTGARDLPLEPVVIESVVIE